MAKMRPNTTRGSFFLTFLYKDFIVQVHFYLETGTGHPVGS